MRPPPSPPMNTRISILCCSLLLLPAGLSAQATPATADTPAVISLGSGFDYSRGDYGLATDTEIPYQTLINLYLRDCAAQGRKLAMHWRPVRSGAA